MDHLSAAGSSATRNLTTTEPPKSLNRRKTVNFRFQRPHATSGSFFFNKSMRAMDSRRDFTSKKVFPGHFSELGEKANSGLTQTPTRRSQLQLQLSSFIVVYKTRIFKSRSSLLRSAVAIHHGLSRVILHTTLILKAKSIWLAVRALSLSLSLSLSFSPENIPASTGQWALLSWVC